MGVSLVFLAVPSLATLPLDWRVCSRQICAGDLQRGIMVWLMLATTLLLTVIHLAAGLTAFFARDGHPAAQISVILRPAHDMLPA